MSTFEFVLWCGAWVFALGAMLVVIVATRDRRSWAARLMGLVDGVDYVDRDGRVTRSVDEPTQTPEDRPKTIAAPGNPFGVVIAGHDPGWLAVDREVWRRFLQTETGRRLRAMIQFYEQGQNRRACLEMNAMAGARAAGFHDAAAWLENLSADVDAANYDEHNQPAQGVRGLVERHRP